METRSDFIWETIYTSHHNDKIAVIVIIDKNLGGMSVTNDAENVIEALQLQVSKNGSNISDMAVVYRDSEKSWGELKVDRYNRFAGFGHLNSNNGFNTMLKQAAGRFKKRRFNA